MAILTSMLEAFYEITASFTKDQTLWWFLTPVIILWVLLELYFGKYKREKLGWNTSLGNATTLTWISIESMRFLFDTNPENFWFRFGVIIAIMLYALLIVYFAFSHRLSANVTYTLASPSPIYFLSLVTILWGHGVLTITWWVLLDLIALYIILSLLFFIIKKIMPESLKDMGDMGGGEPPDLDFGKGDLGLGKEDPDLKGLKDLKL